MENAHSGEHAKKGFFARIPFQIKAAAVVLLIYLGIAFSLYAKLKHLPGPYYGGDLYSHHGFALNYIANGFWTDPFFINNYAFYPWLGNYLFIALHWVTGMSVMNAEMFVGLLTVTLSAIAYYFLGWQLFKSRQPAVGDELEDARRRSSNHTWAFVFFLLSLVTRGIPDGAPNITAWMITIPLWFAFWLRAEETHTTKDKVLAGVFMGCTALTHVAYFLAAMAVFLFTIVVETLRQKKWKDAVKTYVPMLAVGFVVSLLFYGPILVKYQAKTLNPLFDYNGPNISTLGVGWMFTTLYHYTFDTSTYATVILSILTILGLIVCALNWSKKTARYALLWYIAGALAPLHHLITRPLLGKGVLPGHLWGIWISLLVFAVYGIRTVMQYAEKKWPSANAQAIILVGVLILSGFLYSTQYDNYNANPWTQFGERMDPTTQAWLSAGDWMRAHTGINDVVLSGDETCFAMNGMSGRKCVFVRRTHANYFVDVEQRYADGIVMLYGNDSALTKKLLADYQVDYLLVDSYMKQFPILVDAKFADYLTQNNVTFTRVRSVKDPATPTASVFDMLSVSAQNLNKALEPRLSEVAHFNAGDQPYIRLFKVNP